MYVDWWSGR